MKLFFFIVLLLFIISCKPREKDVLMWLNRYSVEKSGNTLSEQFPFFEIKKKYRDVLIKKLNYEKYVILSVDDYYLLTGQILKKKYGLAIRGIGSHPDGEFGVFKNYKNELYVISYLTTDDFSYYKKAVLVIEIDEIPEDIYNILPTENMVREVVN